MKYYDTLVVHSAHMDAGPYTVHTIHKEMILTTEGGLRLGRTRRSHVSVSHNITTIDMYDYALYFVLT